MSTMQFADTNETVVRREEFSLEKARQVLKNKRIAVLGYGVQGPAQACNLRDNGFDVIVGQRCNSASFEKAQADGWQVDVNLFDIPTACERSDVIAYQLSDAGQIAMWQTILPHLSAGKTLLFSHGFAVTYQDKTNIKPPQDIDVVLVAPKGSGRSVRQLFLQKRGINASYGVYQDATGQATQTALAYGIGIGSGYLFETTFEREVTSDLVGERGVLMGALAGLIEAQYEVLRQHGHSPSEAFNETVEELTQSLVPLIGEQGMAWMFGNCSTTAQRGALDWLPRFKQATLPLFNELYEHVQSGQAASEVIDANGRDDYRERLNKELSEMRAREIWRAGEQVYALRAQRVDDE